MRALALISSAIGLLLLCVVADLKWGFVRLPLVGFEAGLIVASLAFFAGIVATASATSFTILQLRRTAGAASFWWLLAGCCVLLLGFGAVFAL